MESARARTQLDGFMRDPVARQLGVYLAHHIKEEEHPSEAGGAGGAILDDLRAINATPEPCPSRVSEHFDWLDDQVWQQHPVAILGCIQMERFHPSREAVERLQEVAGLPRRAVRQMLLHSAVDVRHAEELDTLIDSLPLQPWQENLIAEAAVATIMAVRESLLDVVAPEGRRVLRVR